MVILLFYGLKGMDGLFGLVLEVGVVGKFWFIFMIDFFIEGLFVE